MKPLLRHLVTGSLLAIYASIALLSESLHSLTPHGQHLGFHVADCIGGGCCHDAECGAHHGCSHCNLDASDEFAASQRAINAGGSSTGCHRCEVCAFLFQSISEAPQVASTPEPHLLVAELPRPERSLYSLAILGLHAARGPPQLF